MSPKFLWIADRVGHQGRDCLLWPFSINGVGYGNFGIKAPFKKTFNAHRVMCEMAHGNAPTPVHEVAHSCGNRGCVNPNHLSWKTRSENQLDRRRHGTAVTSRYGNKGKLTAQDKQMILALRDTEPKREIAKKFMVCYETIALLHRRNPKSPV